MTQVDNIVEMYDIYVIFIQLYDQCYANNLSTLMAILAISNLYYR